METSKLARITVRNLPCWLRRDVLPEQAQSVIDSTLEDFFAGRLKNLKRGRRKELYRISDHAGRPYLLKVNHYPLLAGIRRAVRPSKARYELTVAQGIADRGLPTPVPFAVAELRRGGILRTCFQWMPLLEDVCDLKELWLDPSQATPREWRAITAALGELARATVEAGVFQDDFAPNNILVRRGSKPELFLIDFERAALRPTQDGSLPKGEQRWMLAKLDRHLAGSSATQRMRFLYAYCRGDAREAQRWQKELQSFAGKLALRDLQRMRRKAAVDGRRYGCVSLEAWKGFAVKERFHRDAVLPLLSRDVENEALWSIRYEGMSAREARDVWARANTLELYGSLVPPPVALLQRADETLLLFQRSDEGECLSSRSDPTAAEASAIRVLLDRLLNLGDLESSLDAKALVLESPRAGGTKARLLDVRAFQFGTGPEVRREEQHIARKTELAAKLRVRR